MSRVLELAIVLVFAAVVPASAVTVYNVDRFDDDASKTACTVAANDCTLRGAIIASNANAGADVINLAALESPCTAAGVPGIPSGITNVALCLTTFHKCRAAQVLESEMPRLRELLLLGGHAALP